MLLLESSREVDDAFEKLAKTANSPCPPILPFQLLMTSLAAMLVAGGFPPLAAPASDAAGAEYGAAAEGDVDMHEGSQCLLQI